MKLKAKSTKEPRSIRINREVFDTIRGTPVRPGHSDQSVLYLLGQNRKGIITACERLTHAGYLGCGWMPYIRSSDVTKAYMLLAKRKTTPGPFGHFFPDYMDITSYTDLDRWDDHFGADADNHPGRIFVRVTSKRAVAIITQQPTSSDYRVVVHRIPIKIVE